MKLLPHQVDSPLWRSIEKELQVHLENLRAQNDNPNKDADQTAFLRGRIAEVKRLLNIAEPEPEVRN